MRCAISLLAFDTVRLSPTTIAPSILKPSFHANSLAKTCLFPPPNYLQYDNTTNKKVGNEQEQDVTERFLSLKLVDWESVTWEVAKEWNDPVTGVATRVANLVWEQLTSYMTLVTKKVRDNDPITSATLIDNNDSGSEDGIHSKSNKLLVLKQFGWHHVAKAVRSHFFGHDMIQWEPEMRTSTQIVLGRRKTTTKPVLEKKPFERIPSRILVAMSFLTHYYANQDKEGKEEDKDKEKVSDTLQLVESVEIAKQTDNIDFKIWDDILPICLTLLDQTNATLVSLGGSGLIHLLDDKQSNSNDFQVFEFWRDRKDVVLHALETALKTIREGPVLLLIAQAQSRLFRILADDVGIAKKRRQTTREWIFLFSQVSTRPSTTGTCWDVLIGGLIPLFHQHSSILGTDAADMLEMGRLGLTAVLPLTHVDSFASTDDKTYFSSLLTLINLMFGAHPIIPNHGGKIMSHLLASLMILKGRTTLTKETETSTQKINEDLKTDFTFHTAAVALALCGPKFAGKLVEEIIHDDKKGYQEELKDTAREVRAAANNLLENYNKDGW